MGDKWFFIMLLGIVITVKLAPTVSDYIDKDKVFLKECKVTCNDAVLEVDPKNSMCKCYVKTN